MMELNENISQEYAKAQKKVRLLTLERSILLENISRIRQEKKQHHLVSPTLSDDLELSDDDHLEKMLLSPLTTQKAPLQSSTCSTRANTGHRGGRASSRGGRRRRASSTTPIPSSTGDHSEQRQDRMITVSSAPPKRSRVVRNVMNNSKTRRVQPVERDEQGNVKLPQQIGVLTVVSLGKIVHDRDTFHNERYIFPVGFTVQRTYPSMIDPKNNTVVVSTILDGGDGPLFHVTAHDMPNQPIIANSATGAWTVVVRRSNEIRHREHSNSASGPDYYGFKHPTIAKLIQDLPGAEKLKYYIPQQFEEMEPRAARGVMAAAQSKRENLEKHGSANMRSTGATTTMASTKPPSQKLPPLSPSPAYLSNNSNSYLQQQQPSSEPLTITTHDKVDNDDIDELHSDNDECGSIHDSSNNDMASFSNNNNDDAVESII
ncbi:hypothetical protein K492DRAFT_157982 [Lichtheimia hyalospora FSU 10163]|nr:hypothetical protein K492DRAFT_157982 [Lichtheimia hyalospora FSU 10163]